MEWITEGFEGFSKGSMENGGQNLYVSRKGVLQRIFQYDVNGDGFADLLFACSQSMYERPPLYVFEQLPQSTDRRELPSGGTYDGVFADLSGSGYDDLVVACQHDGTHSDVTAFVYFGSHEGLTERYRMELPAPSSVGVAVGDFNGNGRKDIAFLSNEKLRVFEQEERGFCPANFTDYPLNAKVIVAADLDGDGCCDLYFKDVEGKTGVLFGGKNGFDLSKIVWINQTAAIVKEGEGSTTAGQIHAYLQWRPCVVTIDQKQYLFSREKDEAAFYTCSTERKLSRAFSLACPNAAAVVSADFTGNGYDDLAFAVFVDRDQEQDCKVYLGGKDGFSEQRVTFLPVKGAINVTAADLDGKTLIICRSGERIERETLSPAFRFAPDGTAGEVFSIPAGDCMRILAGRPDGSKTRDTIVSLNHELNRAQGAEHVFVYLGGKDGYLPERRLEFPAHSAVDGAMCDFFDTGKVDVLVCNCFEDALHLDDGCYLYPQGEAGFSQEKKVIFPTLHCSGSAIGDFRKSGYLDIAFGGFCNREILIFHGSEAGYSKENVSRVVLGPDDGSYRPEKYGEGQDVYMSVPPEERAVTTEFGQVRWMLSADFNCDGWPDLFISEITGPRCFILWGGPEGFSTKRMTTLLTDGVSSANVADLNGNGWPDLILASHQSTKKNVRYESYVTVYWGGKEGYSENRRMQLPVSCANAVTVGDYNGNGSLDLYATSYNNGRTRDLLSYLYKGDHGEYSIKNVQYLFNHSGSGCVSGDFNGDGYTDLAVACHKEYGNHCSHSYIFWGGPDGLSEDRKTVLPTVGPHGMTTVDPGNILDRGDRERYTSERKRLPEETVLTGITWEGECTSTSWVELSVRAASSEAELVTTGWQRVESGEDLTTRSLSGVVQYQVALCAKCACGTPRIKRVRVTYERRK